MGIKNLNRFLLDNCTTRAIKKMHLSELSGRIIAIDTSIYLYKYVEKEALIENLYLMISKLIYYRIVPVFIFDGKPPIEKKELIEKRKCDKKLAEDKFNLVKREMEEFELDESASKSRILEMKTEMESLKKQFVRIKDADFSAAKSLFDAMGVSYFESCGEADNLCAYLVKYGHAWACMSDDMDMFLYDCPRVLRHMSLLKDSAIFYDTSLILRELDMSLTDFKTILILSGTDYNVGDENPHLYDVVDLYSDYRKWIDCQYLMCLGKNRGDVRKGGVGSQAWTMQFIEWVSAHVCPSQMRVDEEKVKKIENMFSLSAYASLNKDEIKKVTSKFPFRVKRMNHEALWKILEDDGFVLVP